MFKTLREKGYEKLILPCAGSFAIAEIAVQAGFPCSSIFASDVCSFSTSIGFFLDKDRTCQDLHNTLVFAQNSPELEGIDGKLSLTTSILKDLALSQLNDSKPYLKRLKDNLSEDYVREQVKSKLLTLKARLGGIHYEIKDLREVIATQYDDKTVVFVDPPVYGKGYEKQFQTDKVSIKDKIQEFDFKSESEGAFQSTLNKPYLCVWYRSFYEPSGLNAIFIEEVKAGRKKIALLTNRNIDVLKAHLVKPNEFKCGGWKVWGSDDELTENSVVECRKIPKEVALYYRNLFVKKMGETDGDFFLGYFIDRKMFGVVGFMLSKIFRGQEQHPLETFGFNVWSDRYPTIHRLLMMFITCAETGRYFKKEFYALPIARFDGVKTVCFLKYRKLKNNNDLFEVKERTWLKDRQLFRILYQTNWHKRGFSDCVREYLKEFQSGRGMEGYVGEIIRTQ